MSYEHVQGRHERPKTEQNTKGNKKKPAAHVRTDRAVRTERAERKAPGNSPEKGYRPAAAQSLRTAPAEVQPGRMAPAAPSHDTAAPAEARSSETGRILRNVIATILVVAAVSVLLATFMMPVLRIYGDAMVPLLGEGNIAVGIKKSEIRPGDVVSVYYGNKLLTKRCIAVQGQTVNIDENGTVKVDNQPLDEPYAINKGMLGKTADIRLPYRVPEGSIFVLGDNRSNPTDSRSIDVGCFRTEDVCGKMFLKIWPLPFRILK